jgi:polysaccharide export outer membrane protein
MPKNPNRPDPKWRSCGVLASILLATTLVVGQSTTRSIVSPAKATEPNSTENASASIQQEAVASEESVTALRLGPGDLLEMSVYNVPELSTKARVGGNGDIYLPLIDYVHVAGLTAEEAQKLIEKRFADGGFVKDPHVSLLVDDYASQGVSILGEVSKPGVYPVIGEQRLFDLISAAGGLTDKAGRSVTITHRNRADEPINVALARHIADDPKSNVAVRPGDTIVVRRADIVYVVGDVNKPSGFLMDSGNLTVLQVIALAGGTNRTAKLSGAKIIRKGPSGMTETPVQLKKILSAKAPDLPMQPDDILFVPTSAARVAISRTAEAAAQAATALSIVAIHP